jgi:hypothetical protein
MAATPDVAPAPLKRSSLTGPLAVAAIFVLAMVALRWDGRTGFTSLLSFGGPKWEQRLVVLRSMPLAKDRGFGYDGQFGAQLAVAPDPRPQEIKSALDNPVYRSRRIFLAWTAHIIGGGNPWTVLQVYALQNVAVWLGLSWLLWRELKGVPRQRALVIWICCMMTIGALDSVRLSLSDLSGVTLLVLAVFALRKGRPWAAACAFAIAGLIRETTILGGGAFWPYGSQTKRPKLKAVACYSCAILPLGMWVIWLSWFVREGEVLGRSNFDWPGLGFLRQCNLCVGQLARGNFDSRYLFGLIGALGLASQSLDILLRPRYAEIWWRLALGFALLFWVISDNVWKGYWAAARALLPMTFAFNLLTTDDRRFWARLSFANAGLVAHGIWRMLP